MRVTVLVKFGIKKTASQKHPKLWLQSLLMHTMASNVEQGVETNSGIRCLVLVKIMAQLQKTLQKLQTVCLN